MRVLLFAGKGGVGKTSLALATALGAAQHGHRVCALSTDAAHSLGDALQRSIGPRPELVAQNVWAQEVSALAELERSWASIRDWLRALLFDAERELIQEELLVLPGFEELVALRALREIESSGAYDLCVVDCAPTGAMFRMLRLPEALRAIMEHFWEWERRAARAVRPFAERVGLGRFVAPEEVLDAIERLYAEVSDVRRILLDEERTSARLVVNPTRVVIEETRRSFAYLSLYGVATDALLVNRVLPVEAAGGYFARWSERERAELSTIECCFPLPILRASLQRREVLGADALRALACELYKDRDPAERLVTQRPLRLDERDGTLILAIDLPTAQRDELHVSLHGDELRVGMRDVERRIALPASLAGSAVASARLSGGVLEVAFAAAPRP
ncbi:MAG: ArsA family ATPase [Myxococcales bacterium]|nr:ArsA family ATPase [Myxococcales bacterium]MDH5306380.1 ArsA family ATPase [Myxococcales bacterium]MDH5566425.1 ArsA family ATPase [Myxococcales bacterium]